MDWQVDAVTELHEATWMNFLPASDLCTELDQQNAGHAACVVLQPWVPISLVSKEQVPAPPAPKGYRLGCIPGAVNMNIRAI